MCLSCNKSHVSDTSNNDGGIFAVHVVMSRNDEANARNDVPHGTLREFFPRTGLDPPDRPDYTRLTRIPRVR